MARYVGTRGKMHPHHDNCIRSNWVFIKAEIDAKDLGDSLIATGALCVEDVDSVLSCKTKNDRNHCFLEILLQRGKGAFDSFIVALEDNGYSHVSQKLKEYCKEKGNGNGDDTGDMFSNTLQEIKQIQDSMNNLERHLGTVKQKLVTAKSHKPGTSYVIQNLSQDVADAEHVMKQKEEEIRSLKDQLQEKNEIIHELKRDREGSERCLLNKLTHLETLCSEQKIVIAELRTSVIYHENEITQQNTIISKSERTISEQTKTIENLGSDVKRHVEVISKQGHHIEQLQKTVSDQTHRLGSLALQNEEQKLTLRNQRKVIREQDEKLEQQQRTLQSQGRSIESLQRDSAERKLAMQEQSRQLNDQAGIIGQQTERIQTQNNQLQQQQKDLDFQKRATSRLEKIVSDKGQQLDSTLKSFRAEMDQMKEEGNIREGQKYRRVDQMTQNDRKTKKSDNKIWHYN